MLQYEYEHVYGIFGRVMKREYFELCDVCQRGAERDRREIEQEIGKPPIPFMRRFGCLIFAIMVVVAVVFALWAELVIVTF